MAYTSSDSSVSGVESHAAKTPLLARRAPAAATPPKLSIHIPKSAFTPIVPGFPRALGQVSEAAAPQSELIETPHTGSSLPTTPRSPRYTRQQEQEWWTQGIEHADEQDWDDYFFQPPELDDLASHPIHDFTQNDELDNQIAAAAEQYQKDDAALRNSATYATTDRMCFGYTVFPSAMKMAQLSAASNEKVLQFFNQYLRIAILFLIWAWALSCLCTWSMSHQTHTLGALDITQCMPGADMTDLDWDWDMDWTNQTQYSRLS